VVPVLVLVLLLVAPLQAVEVVAPLVAVAAGGQQRNNQAQAQEAERKKGAKT
jgi:hypothetical protein